MCLDAELMSSGGFLLEQLMELAGLGVAQVVSDAYPTARNVLLCAVVRPNIRRA